MIKFYTNEEYDMVFKLRPWFLEEDLLVLEPWNPMIPRTKVDLTTQILWLRLYNMQPEFSNPPIVKSIASMGEVKELDPSGCIVPKGKVQKVKVLINDRDPLRRGFG